MARATLLALVLAACTAGQQARPADPADAPLERGTGHTCKAAGAQGLVGKPRNEAVGRRAQRLSGAAAIRWVPMGAMVTMDYRADRLNIHLDKSGRIAHLDCG